ncbi:conserved hypothetical protein, membrane [mine drainage metagenome]|uniref:Uncharacterized protein n=1 Tax=mine drainage metagenome TaxID=410659 RepID=T1AIZ8_9ZZZZ
MGNCVVAAIPLAFFGVLFSFLLVAISYMLGSVFNIAALKGWYQNELKEAVKSILIIIVIFSMFIILSSIAASYVGNPGSTLTTSSSAASTEITNNLASIYNALETSYFTPQLGNANNAFYELAGLYDGIGVWKSMTLSVYIPIPLIPVFTIASLDFGVNENLYVSSVVASTSDPTFSVLSDVGKLIVVPVMIILKVQADLLAEIIGIGLGVLLPVGIVLRAVPILRPLGGTFLALAIGISLVYPALLLGINLPISNYLPPTTIPPPTALCPSGWNSIECGFYVVMVSLATSGLYDVMVTLSNPAVHQVLTGFGYGLESYGSIYPAFNTILSQSFLVLILQFILFALDLIIGVVIMQHIASLLGGSLRLGIGKMKLA